MPSIHRESPRRAGRRRPSYPQSLSLPETFQKTKDTYPILMLHGCTSETCAIAVSETLWYPCGRCTYLYTPSLIECFWQRWPQSEGLKSFTHRLYGAPVQVALVGKVQVGLIAMENNVLQDDVLTRAKTLP